MLDQSFSKENFKKIIDIENRKGIYLEGEFYPDIVEISNRIKRTNSEIKFLKKRNLPKEEYDVAREILNEEKDSLKTQKDELLKDRLTVVSSNVTSNDFKLQLQVDNTITSKPVYKTEHSIENILTLKQLQYNFRKLYKVKQSNRYSIISQLKNLLNDGFPKIIVKTDIKEFYESIPHDKLLKKIYDENLLTYFSQKFIQQILNEYKSIPPAKTKGVPRGIGISPYLVELYMRDIDERIRNLPNVMYYSRYVDDIIVIFMPPIDNKIIDYKNEIKSIFTVDGLTMNEEDDKTKVIDLSNKDHTQVYKFEYLGYRFISGYNEKKHIPLILTISKRKRKRYADRLNKALDLYYSQSKGNEKNARKILMRRIRFLMGNTRLVNNKKNVLTGIYYVNSLINTTHDLKILDRYYNSVINKSSLPPPLKDRLKSYSFKESFNPSYITKFNAMELNTIMNNWKK